MLGFAYYIFIKYRPKNVLKTGFDMKRTDGRTDVQKLITASETIQNRVPPNAVMEGRKEILYLTTHPTHFLYGYMASDILW